MTTTETAIKAPSSSLKADLIALSEGKAKPVGALGRLEELAIALGCMQNSLSPSVNKPHILVFAADHGIATAGLVNAYPQQVTALMVQNFLQGGAAINALCQTHDLGLRVIDAGVNAILPPHEALADAKAGMGTADYREQPAMSKAQVQFCLDSGATQVRAVHEETGCNVMGFGEMGISNSAAAALLLSSLQNLPIGDCVGAGAGMSPEQLAQKKAVLQAVIDKHGVQQDPIAALSCYGGFEIAMICGAMLEAARLGICIVVDGFIVTAALLAAVKMQPAVRAWCLFAHTSAEQGHRLMLEALQANPLLQLDMRLGTGAAMAMPLLRSACAYLQQMANLKDLMP